MAKKSTLRLYFQEDFYDFVEKRCNLVYPQDKILLDARSLTLKKKVADLVQQFKESSFFSSTQKFGSTDQDSLSDP